MTSIIFDEFDSRLPSARLWKAFSPPAGMGPLGATFQTPGGNPAFGFFDNFHSFQASTLEGPYLLLETATGAIEQIADTATEKGLVSFVTAGDTAEDELVLQWGRGLGAPFKLADKDLVFEARFSISSITTAKVAIGVGLGEVGMGATDCLFIDTTQALADKNFCGYVKLKGETDDFDGAYKADGQTYQDGAVKTKLDSLATFTASATTYHKLGFRYRAHPKKLEWFVDNALPGGNITPARLTAAELAAATFPDDVFMAPIMGIKDAAGDTAVTMNLDWWGCAQYL